MPQALSKDEQWEKLQIWLTESIASIERGDLTRMPATFTGERGEAAVQAMQACQQAMHFLENWERFGLPRHGAEDNEGHGNEVHAAESGGEQVDDTVAQEMADAGGQGI